MHVNKKQVKPVFYLSYSFKSDFQLAHIDSQSHIDSVALATDLNNFLTPFSFVS